MNNLKANPSEEPRSYRDQLLTIGDLEKFKGDLLITMRTLIEETLSPHLNKKWLKTQEVKKILNISSGTLQNLRDNGSLPYKKIGGLIYFDMENINKLMAGQGEDPFSAIIPYRKNK